MKIIRMLVSVMLLAGCASQEVPAPLPKEPNEIIIEKIKDKGLSARETAVGVEVFLPDLLFEINKAALSDRAIGTIGVVANIVKKEVDADRRIVVSGHTDATGSEEFNMKLSEARAIAVVDVLVESGIKYDRIEARWFGETKPKMQNYFSSGKYNVAGQSINRRVEVVILNSASAN